MGKPLIPIMYTANCTCGTRNWAEVSKEEATRNQVTRPCKSCRRQVTLYR